MATQTSKIEAGQVLLPRSAPWLDELKSELLQFPHGQHDDQVDCFSQFLAWVEKRSTSALLSWDFGYGKVCYDPALGRIFRTSPLAPAIVSGRGTPRGELGSPQPVRQDNVLISTKWGLISAGEYAARSKKSLP